MHSVLISVNIFTNFVKIDAIDNDYSLTDDQWIYSSFEQRPESHDENLHHGLSLQLKKYIIRFDQKFPQNYPLCFYEICEFVRRRMFQSRMGL